MLALRIGSRTSEYRTKCIRIGDDVYVYLDENNSSKVKLAISAPREIKIVRLDSEGHVVGASKEDAE